MQRAYRAQAGPGDRIGYARLESDGARVIAPDGHPDYPAKVGENVAIALGGSDKERLTRVFNDLAEGGRVQMPLMQQPSGAQVGWLMDRFGIHWTISVEASVTRWTVAHMTNAAPGGLRLVDGPGHVPGTFTIPRC